MLLCYPSLLVFPLILLLGRFFFVTLPDWNRDHSIINNDLFEIMLNRRILRIKAFKILYSCAEDRSLSTKDALSMLESSAEASRDLYLFVLASISPLTKEAARRIEAARSKFNPTEEDLNPNMKFASNALATILDEDVDFCKMLEKRKLSWEPYDAAIRNLFDSISSKDYFKAYMESPEKSVAADAKLFKCIFEEEFEDNEEFLSIMEDMNILWLDDLGYVLRYDISSVQNIARTGEWNCPPIYSEPTDNAFVTKLISATLAGYDRYFGMVAESVSKWDSDRLFTTDTVLIAMGLAEAENFDDIPVPVTINEYVEISKYYSTPKSRSFVNGLLDKLIKEEAAAGLISKSI